MAFSIPKLFLLLISSSFITSTWALNTSSTTSLDAHLSTIRTVCSSRPFPDACFNSLKLSISINISPNIINLLLQTLQTALSEAGKLTNLFSKAGGSNIIERQRGTIQDCLELHRITVSSLQRSVSRVRAGDSRKLVDARTYLSAALTNKNTCLEGLDSASGPLKPAVLSSLTSTYQHVSNSLSMLPKPKRSKQGHINRRLLGFPKWMSKKDRRILQSIDGEYDPSEELIVAADGTGNFSTITDAINFAPNNSYDRIIIRVREGVYAENVEISSDKTNIVLIGDGADLTFITGNRNVADGWTTFRSATLAVSGDGFLALDITIDNTAGPEKHQAVALRVNADLVAFYRCSVNGYQDTLYAHSFRQFYRECNISGTIDYLFGNAAVIFQACNIISRKPLPNQFTVITAQSRETPDEDTGISMQNCSILATEDLPSFISSMEISQVEALEIKDRRAEGLGNLQVLPDELICSILDNLTPRDVARSACASSVMYILCNEEPLWMSLCLNRVNGPLQYKGSWKKTALDLENVPEEYQERCGKPLQFNGFSSLFLYKRLYRCHTTLSGFNFDDGNVERKGDLSLEEFSQEYDGRKPVLLAGLADTWPARNTWAIDQLSLKYGDLAFRISQSSCKKISMKMKDYVSYMYLQHDEDPLYIFDDKFGETAPSLLKDYSVPHLFQEDLFEVLDGEQRPPFRWLIIGPERSGASWHVDPALTSAWNTLLCGRKRWALYPPGRVPLGVTVHVNEDDGDVTIDTPSSLQWWLDFYPLLTDEDKPIECTQLPGETVFVPSGWWHCVLNLEPTVAVTQNFVNSKNFEYVCLDMAPGYRHKGVCRVGLLALDDSSLEDLKMNMDYDKDDLSYADLTRKEKRIRVQEPIADPRYITTANGVSKTYDLWKQGFSYDIKFLAMYLDKERNHYSSPWSSSNSIGPREMREWLSKLWVGRPELRELVWKGACIALQADKWLDCLEEICAFHNFPSPTADEKLPVGTGSNPVYLLADCAIKILVEGGLEAAMYALGTELEFYSVLSKVNSPLKNHVPEVLASGIIYLDNGALKIVPWDGKGVPIVIGNCNLILENWKEDDFVFGVWGKKHFECRQAGMPMNEPINSAGCTSIWPFIITRRCKGKIFAQLRDMLSWEEMLNLTSFLGEQLRNLHLLPYPSSKNSSFSDIELKVKLPFADGYMEDIPTPEIPEEWKVFIRTLCRRKMNVTNRLENWGDPIPRTLIEKVDDYIPDDLTKLLNTFQAENGTNKSCKPCSWIHSDIMDDNVHMEPYRISTCSGGNASDPCLADNDCAVGNDHGDVDKSWCPSHILDFSNLSSGDRIYDVIPIYLDIFRGDSSLFKQFLESYRLPFLTRNPEEVIDGGDRFERLSYHAMCYCILHEENILGSIFSIWKELRMAKSWEEVELTVWGELNNYKCVS